MLAYPFKLKPNIFRARLLSFMQGGKGTKLKKAIVIKQEKAMQLQRNGKLREYAVIMSEIENLEKRYEEVVNENR